MGTEDPRRQLANEIFHLTGQKVQIDDPIVLAALVQSKLIRQAGEDARNLIQASLAVAQKEFAAAADAQRVLAADIARATELARVEVPGLRARVSVIAQQILKQTDEAAKAKYGSQRSSTVRRDLVLVFLLGMAIGSCARLF